MKQSYRHKVVYTQQPFSTIIQTDLDGESLNVESFNGSSIALKQTVTDNGTSTTALATFTKQ